MTLDDVRRLALALPETTESTSYGQPAWKVRSRTFAWERPLRRGDLEALGAAAPQGTVLGARVEHEGAKAALVAVGPPYFTTPHFDGYPAILVALDDVGESDLEELLVEGWLAVAPKRLAASFLEARGG